MSYPNKLIKTILSLNKLYLRLNVVPNERGEYMSKMTYNKNTYLSSVYKSFLILGMYSENGEGWEQSKTIILNNRNIYILLRVLKRYIDNIYNADIFAIDSGGHIIIHSDVAAQCKELIKLPYSNNSSILLHPTVLRDKDDVEYEGTLLFLNKSENYIELNIDDLECLYHTLKRIDIDLMSQLMVNSILKEDIASTPVVENDRRKLW